MKRTRRGSINYSGQTFGRLKVIKPAPYKRYGHLVWLCECSCGNPNLHPVLAGNLIRTNSCGCWKKDQAGKASITHGETGSLRHRMWCNARKRAKKIGVPCDIDLADIVIPSTCPVLGLPLRKGVKKTQDGSPSLDRLSPERGYVKGNIWVISHRANRIKNDSSLEEIKKLINAIKKQERT